MSSELFYQSLPAFSDFGDIGDLTSYQPVPDDWVVLAADIVNSRQAIAAGNYKNVNMIGAAVVASVVNTLGRETTPFVFGGDGALVMVPGSRVEEGKKALAGVASLAREAANLTLRIAAIPVTHLRGKGTDVRLRKLELSKGNYLAMAVGDGLEMAETILKDPQEGASFAIEATSGTMAALGGLSCRWDPMPAQKDKIATLIIKPSAPDKLGHAMEIVASSIGGQARLSRDEGLLATRDRIRFRFPPRALGFEARLHRISGEGWAYLFKGLFESVAFVWGMMSKRRVGPFESERYLDELARNTDHRKLDDSLRLVLDVSNSELEALHSNLEEARVKGLLTFGLHISDQAIMTCLVSDIGAGQHIHFIDGSDGGFAMAAEDHKNRSGLQVA